MSIPETATGALVEIEELDHRLATAIDPLPLFRETLRRGADESERRFLAGAPIGELVHGRSDLVDQILVRAWNLYLPQTTDAALVAVGGYGRGELHPGSDVDILILLGSGAGDDVKNAIAHLIAFLWDVGLEVGHSVRTLAECVGEASGDITIITNLLEARAITGELPLFHAMEQATAPERIWSSEDFFAAKWLEQQVRWHKYGDTAYNLEPNIKENPGGLRDIQMIGWVTARHFGTRNLHDLVTQGFLTETEYQTLIERQAHLWRIRFALHRLTRRREDRLLFDYQRTLALQFGYRDTEATLAVEQFMQAYYRTVIVLNRLNEMLLQLFQEAILLRDAQDPPTPINRRFQVQSGFLEVTSRTVFKRYPLALLELFLILENHPEISGVRASTIRLIRQYRSLIDEGFRADIRARSLFMEILRQPQGITHALRRMNRYGILARYLPMFANIVGRMQYDLFHVYTVDEHTLLVIRNLRRLDIPKHYHEFPLCSAIIRGIPKLELLYLAGLFHDIAKGRGGDHSLIGAADAREFCQAHGLSEFDSRLVAWLVEKHLSMSMTAQRRDISDPEVIQDFAAQVGDLVRLDYLYLLTIADVRATNPQRWNAWKDALLRDLYQATRRALLRGLHNPQAQDELIQQKQAEALRALQRQGFDLDCCKAQWLLFNIDFFLSLSPDEIAWQTGLVLAARPGDLPLVAIRPFTARGSTEVFLYTRDRDNLFALSTATLDQLGLNILNARIMTTNDAKALNSYLVLEQDGSPITAAERLEEIRATLEQAMYAPGESPFPVKRRMPRQYRHFTTPTQIAFSTDETNHRTVMRLLALDRPGLLADVGLAFAECRIRVHNAKIATVGADVEDVFFITGTDNHPVTQDGQLDCLRERIVHRLSERA
jgi:[protein-PII] uridylyltransferase